MNRRGWRKKDEPATDLVALKSSGPEGPHKLAIFLSQEAKQLQSWIATNSERCRDANSPFEPLMRRVNGPPLDSKKIQ